MTMKPQTNARSAARAIVQQARMAGHQIHHFHGGLRLRHNKKIACETPLERPPMPDHLCIPLIQHATKPAPPSVHCKVEKGQQVLKGQVIGSHDDWGGGRIHASSSGTVISVSKQPMSHPSGHDGVCVTIEPDGEDRWCDLEPIADWQSASTHELLARISMSGIVGLGGAVFPTGFKMSAGRKNHQSRNVDFNKIHTLILNGAECEPYISCDEMLMRENPERIILGADILRYTLGAERVVIAIEDQMGVVRRALIRAIEKSAVKKIDVVQVTTIYPEGGERQLIQVLTGLEVPAEGHPSDLGLLCQNVATASAVADSVVDGRPLIERIVSVTGPGIKRPRNLVALLGTPISHLVEQCGGYADTAARMILGGPMMGYALPSDDNPVIKAANCILVLTEDDLRPAQVEMPCINCGECARVCPATLLPQQLHWQISNSLWDEAAQNGLTDCIECGCCDFVCPSHIPLTDRFRVGKTDLRTREAERRQARHAKNRFDAREKRLAKELEGRVRRHETRKNTLREDAKKRIADALERSQQFEAKPTGGNDATDSNGESK